MPDTALNIDKILCPTDFSDSAASAFAESIRLARWLGAQVTVLHVLPFAVSIEGAAGYMPMPMPVENGEAVRKAKLMEIQRFVNATAHNGVPIETALREGDPSDEIREAVRETGADLVVMGTHGRSGFKRLTLGSVTEAVLRDAPAPVLTVHRDLVGRKGLFRRIICATDISKRTAGTIAAAMAFVDEAAKHLTVLNVIEDGRESAGGDLERAASDALFKLIPEEVRNSCQIEHHVAFGEADREILRLAAEEDADLVIMGAHRHAPLAGLFATTVRGVVRDAKCPVLLVPPEHAEPVGARS